MNTMKSHSHIMDTQDGLGRALRETSCEKLSDALPVAGRITTKNEIS